MRSKPQSLIVHVIDLVVGSQEGVTKDEEVPTVYEQAEHTSSGVIQIL